MDKVEKALCLSVDNVRQTGHGRDSLSAITLTDNLLMLLLVPATDVLLTNLNIVLIEN